MSSRAISALCGVVAFCLTSAVAFAADAPVTLPDKPVIVQSNPPYTCTTYGYLEGPSLCGWLQGLGEPVFPVTDENTRLAVRMLWGIGDRNTTITIRIEIQSAEQAFIKVYEGTGAEARWQSLQGQVTISPADIGLLLAAEHKADIWSKPRDLVPIDGVRPSGCQIETVILCYNYMTLAEVRDGEQKVVYGACPDRKINADVIAFAHLLLRVAQHEFPGVATTQLWREELKS